MWEIIFHILAIAAWQGDNKQVNDIIFIGFKAL